MADKPPPGNVTSIVGQLRRRQLERARALAERSRWHELVGFVEMAEISEQFESGEMDANIEALVATGDPEAIEVAAQLRAIRAAHVCAKGDEDAGLAELQELMDEWPKMALPLIARARWWMEKKQPERALPDLDRAVDVAPNDAVAYQWRGRCLVQLGDHERALANLRRAVALDPEPGRLRMLADALSDHGDHEEALAAWTRLITTAPGYVDFHLGRARELEKKEKFETSLADWDRIVELDPDSAALRFSRAMTLSILERDAEAVEEVQRVSDSARDNAMYLRSLGELRVRTGSPDVGLAALTRSIELEPTAEAFAARARAHKALGDTTSALADFEKSLEIDPTNDVVAMERFTAMISAIPEQPERLFDEIEKMAGRMPDSAFVAELEASVRKVRHDPDGELAALDRAIALDPDSGADRYLSRAKAHAALQHVQQAFDDATRAIELDPNLAAAYVARGVYRTHLEEDFAAALADMDHAIELAPDDASAHYQRHEVLSLMDDHQGALAACERAIALAPTVGQLYFERAECRTRLEEEQEGWRAANIADCDRALGLGYADAWVYVHKAIVQQELGDLAAAVATLDVGIARFPEEGCLYDTRAGFRKRLGDDEGCLADEERARELGFGVEQEDD